MPPLVLLKSSETTSQNIQDPPILSPSCGDVRWNPPSLEKGSNTQRNVIWLNAAIRTVSDLCSRCTLKSKVHIETLCISLTATRESNLTLCGATSKLRHPLLLSRPGVRLAYLFSCRFNGMGGGGDPKTSPRGEEAKHAFPARKSLYSILYSGPRREFHHR